MHNRRVYSYAILVSSPSFDWAWAELIGVSSFVYFDYGDLQYAMFIK